MDGFSGILLKLCVLHLSGNPLRHEDIMRMLPKNYSLAQLSLGYIGLTGILPDLIHYVSKIQYLNLSCNFLSSIPLELLKVATSAGKLDISGNEFQRIPLDLIDIVTCSKTLCTLAL